MKKSMTLAVVLLAMAGLLGCKAETSAPELLEPVEVKKDVAEAEIGDIYEAAVYNGEIAPYVEELYFFEEGSLEALYAAAGETVREGDVLASLNVDAILEQIESLKEEIDNITRLGEFSDRQASADISIAGEELAILKESQADAQTCKAKELEIRQLELKLQQARELRSLELQEKQTSLEKLQEKAGNNELIAPFTGTVVYISDLKQGDSIKEYETVICLADDSRLMLSTDYITEVILTGADKIYAKIMDQNYEVSYIPYDKSEYIEMAISGETLKTRFSIEAGAGEIESGQFAAIVVLDSYKENVLTIPVNALYQDELGKYVYRQVDGRQTRCDVTVGLVSDTKAEILEGLEEGDVVYVKD